MSQASDLDRFPRPAVTIDLAVLTVTGATDRNPRLRLLVQDRKEPDGRALPGGFVRERQTIQQTVTQVLARKVGVDLPEGRVPKLLRVFDDPHRDDRTWAISLAHSLSVPESLLLDPVGDLVEVGNDRSLVGEGALLFDHDAIVAAAIEKVRKRYDVRPTYVATVPDPDRFLPEPFTIQQLRLVHEAVVGKPLSRDLFRRRVMPYLREASRRDGKAGTATGMRGKPAVLYRRAEA